MAGRQQKAQFVDQKTSEAACTYAALILHDDGIEVRTQRIISLKVTANNMNKLFKHLNLRVEPFWPKVFEKALKGKNVGDLLVGGGEPAAQGPATSAPVAAEAPKEAPKDTKKEKEKGTQ